MSAFVVGARGDTIYQSLYDAGVLAEDPSRVSRVILDLKAGSPARFYIETFADTKLIDVFMDGGIKLIEKGEGQ